MRRLKLLGQRLSRLQWVALSLLTAGVGLVQIHEVGAGAAVAAAAGAVPLGVAAVLASSLLSGFANIYFEKVLKQAECELDDSCDVDGARREPASLWLRNIQLGLFSIPQV